MRKLNLLIALFSFLISHAQNAREIPIKTKVEEVTVFVENAQIIRKKTVPVEVGISVLKFEELSPFIIPSSIQAKLTGDLTVLSVNHQQDFLEELEKPGKLVELEQKLQNVKNKMDVLNAETDVMNEQISFLNTNKNIGGSEALDVNSLKAAMDYYKSRLTSLKMGILQNSKKIGELQKEMTELTDQINTMTSVKEYAKGVVAIKIKSKRATKTEVELSYVVKNAGWLPFYDIKAKNINSPIELVYQANVKQDTKIDWNNVKIRLSTANPNISGVKPELQTYYLNYSTPPPVYNSNLNQVSGVVLDQDGLPLPGANVMVQGTTIGTVTDFDGRYSLSVPSRGGSLEFSYIGFTTVNKPILNPVVNVIIEEDSQALEEVVVLAYGTTKRRLKTKEPSAGDIEVASKKPSNIPIPIDQIQRQTTVEFEIELPFTVPSDNNSYAIDMVRYDLPADYKYISIPKIEPAAFLTANISDWEKYNLLEGEANLFFENTFVGKTILDVRYASDTLQLSLGRDKGLSINREKRSDFTSKKFIGSKKEEIREWQISLKNNKAEQVEIEIFDQIPVSTLDEITVEVLEKSRAKINSENGEVKWEISLPPNGAEEKTLKYSVKYPKNKRLYIE